MTYVPMSMAIGLWRSPRQALGFYITLPAGPYDVKASYDNQVKETKNLEVSKDHSTGMLSMQRPAKIDQRFLSVSKFHVARTEIARTDIEGVRSRNRICDLAHARRATMKKDERDASDIEVTNLSLPSSRQSGSSFAEALVAAR